MPTYSWLRRCASWKASCMTFRERSVKRFAFVRSSLEPGCQRTVVSGDCPVIMVPGTLRCSLVALARSAGFHTLFIALSGDLFQGRTTTPVCQFHIHF